MTSITAIKTTAPRFIKVQAIKRPSCIRKGTKR